MFNQGLQSARLPVAEEYMLPKSEAVTRWIELLCRELFKALIHLDALCLLLTAEFSVSQQPKDREQDQSVISFQ